MFQRTRPVVQTIRSSLNARQFSQVTVRHLSVSSNWHDRKSLPVFPDNLSSPELTEQIEYLHDQFFIPSSLHEKHRKELYSPSKVDDKPIEVEVDGKKYPLAPGRLKPRHTRAQDSLFKCVDGFKTDTDWQSLQPLLQGLTQSNVILRPFAFRRIFSRARSAGQTDVILTCAQDFVQTQAYIRGPIISSVIEAVRGPAAEADWAATETSASLRRANLLTTILSRQYEVGLEAAKTKAAEEGQAKKPEDVRANVQLMALHLEIHARSSAQSLNLEDVSDHSVQRLAEGLKINWEQQQYIDPESVLVSATRSPLVARARKALRPTYEANVRLLHDFRIWNALSAAIPVLEKKDSVQDLVAWLSDTKALVRQRLGIDYATLVQPSGVDPQDVQAVNKYRHTVLGEPPIGEVDA
ncbi:MAG: hypothetical protein M1814_001656 [Vezdaea aestivalis]|nr:MAG: hypothetical protein M1814_001656 [Vezdaea aestivalis]